MITDAKGEMRISLRDFRPHVASLLAIGRRDLANLITQDYLDGYAEDFNTFIKDLSRITLASREATEKRSLTTKDTKPTKENPQKHE